MTPEWPPPAEEYTAEQTAWFETHCASCSRKDPSRVRVRCGECFHGWRWGWLLSLHDMRSRWRAGAKSPWGPATAWHARIRLRRPSKVWVCPCCSHDL